MHCETTKRPPSIAPNSTAMRSGSTSANSTAVEPRWRAAADRFARHITQKLYLGAREIGRDVSPARCATHPHARFPTSNHPPPEGDYWLPGTEGGGVYVSTPPPC